MRLRTILVPTDFSPRTSEALRRATILAAQHGAELHVFHAQLLHAPTPSNEGEARRAVDQVVEQVLEEADIGAGRRPKLNLTLGRSFTAEGAIIGAAADIRADLVVMGISGRSSILGTIAERVARRCPCSLLVVRRGASGGWPMRPATILVAVDFSTHSRAALEAGRSLRQPGGRLVAAHVVPVGILPGEPKFLSPFVCKPELEGRVMEHTKRWVGDDADEVVVAAGNVASRLVAEGLDREAGLIVVGTRGLGGVKRLLLGSVAERVIHLADPPVLVVRPTDDGP